MQWLNRSQLTKKSLSIATGALCFSDEPNEISLPLALEEMVGSQEISRQTLSALNLHNSDKVLVHLNQNGSPATTLLAQAFTEFVASVSTIGPQGRMRLLSTIKQIQPNVLVTTPCGAMDFLARLYMEFNVDPIELGLEKIILTGEIASPGTHRRLANEFESDIYDLYCDPYFGVALATGQQGKWQSNASDHIGVAEINSDVIISNDISAHSPQSCDKTTELVITPSWSSALNETVLRTGQIIQADTEQKGLFNHTVGEHVLVRGRWVSLQKIKQSLKTIDGITDWTLGVDRGEGTLDAPTVHVSLNRDSLVNNPMWQKRIEESLTAATPVHLNVETQLLEEAPEESNPVNDLRQHHLGIDRSTLSL